MKEKVDDNIIVNMEGIWTLELAASMQMTAGWELQLHSDALWAL